MTVDDLEGNIANLERTLMSTKSRNDLKVLAIAVAVLQYCKDLEARIAKIETDGTAGRLG